MVCMSMYVCVLMWMGVHVFMCLVRGWQWVSFLITLYPKMPTTLRQGLSLNSGLLNLPTLHDKCFISWAIYPALIWIFKTGSSIKLRDQKLGHTAWPAILADSSVSISLYWDYNKYMLGANSYPLVLLIEASPQLLFPALRDNIIIENLFCFTLETSLPLWSNGSLRKIKNVGNFAHISS